jgi:PHD/YefM family antitoxin component YafN of YafNO toxin-antitoxin module
MKMHKLHVRPERELRNNFSEISKLNKQYDAVVLTNRGKGTHVLLSFDEFDDYEEYRHNRYLMEKIKEAEDDTDTRLRSHEEVWQGLGKKYAL